MDLYLRIAPELYLKRLLVGGFERVFEIEPRLPQRGHLARHNPEFTMLEFYQAYANYEDLMQMTEDLFVRSPNGARGTRVPATAEREIDFAPPWRRLSIPEYVAAQALSPEGAWSSTPCRDGGRALDIRARRGATTPELRRGASAGYL